MGESHHKYECPKCSHTLAETVSVRVKTYEEARVRLKCLKCEHLFDIWRVDGNDQPKSLGG